MSDKSVITITVHEIHQYIVKLVGEPMQMYSGKWCHEANVLNVRAKLSIPVSVFTDTPEPPPAQAFVDKYRGNNKGDWVLDEFGTLMWKDDPQT